MKTNVNLYIKCMRTGKVLGVTKGVGTNNWNLPGGKLEENEDFISGAFREVKEETGVDFNRPSVGYTWDPIPFISLCKAQDDGDVEYVLVFWGILCDSKFFEPMSSSEGDAA